MDEQYIRQLADKYHCLYDGISEDIGYQFTKKADKSTIYVRFNQDLEQELTKKLNINLNDKSKV